MRFRTYIVLVVLWLASLVGVGVLAQGQQPQPMVISGNDDIGFRPDAVQRGNRVVGTWVVRINGQWVETQSATTLSR
jgi:hypothetical protein